MKLLHSIHDFSVSNPDSPAFISPERVISYEELWQKSEHVANYIMTKDLPKGSAIMVYGHMEPEMIVSFLGCVKSGHPYIPIDTSIPLERIDRIGNSSQSDLLINVSGLPLEVTLPSLEIVQFDQLLTTTIESVETSSWVSEDDNFYIIYTSGSTGNPKGVQISANNLQSFVNWMTDDFPINGHLRFLNQAPFSFDLSVMDLYPALATGGCIFAITKDLIARPKILFESLQKSKTQVWTSTPSFVQMCLMDPSFNEGLLPDLTCFLFCGEILPVTISRQLLERFPKTRVFNTYGPTEATVAITSVEITNEILDQYQSLPVGSPKKDTKLLLLEENGIDVAEGEKGEIIIVGPSVSKGYLGEPGLTEKAFFTHNGEMAYRTGDAGYMENNLLFYKGRMDFQIKLHGYRMELEEIEHHISESNYVKSAVIVPVYQNDKIEYLTAAIVPANHNFEKEYQLTSAIKKELGEKLPAYMIPRKFIYQEELPMTPNGKIDRKLIKEKVLA